VSALVVDASVLLAIAQDEAGANAALRRLLAATSVCVSAVNLAEMAGVLARKGLDRSMARKLCGDLGVASIPFDDRFVEAVGALALIPNRPALSLADRCCLALACVIEAPVLTGDRAWRQLNPGRYAEVGLSAPKIELFRD